MENLSVKLFSLVWRVYAQKIEFYKNITMERNNRKKYIHIHWETGSNEIYAMLDEIESDTESDIENLLEDYDTEHISEEPIPDNKEESHRVLTPSL